MYKLCVRMGCSVNDFLAYGACPWEGPLGNLPVVPTQRKLPLVGAVLALVLPHGDYLIPDSLAISCPWPKGQAALRH